MVAGLEGQLFTDKIMVSFKSFLLVAFATLSILISSCGGGSGDVTQEPNPLPLPQPTEPPTQEIPVSETKTITQTIDGQQVDRTYLIRYPSEVTKASYPVVFFFHGAGGNGQGWLSNRPEVENLIDQENFIGIFPDGFENRWNVGTETNADDVEFVTLIVNEFSSNELFNVDKIYAIGTSNGAGLANKIGKETAIFKGIAPLISQQTEEIGAIVPSSPMSVFQVGGTEDGLVPINGGNGVAGHIFMSAAESAENWASNFNCNMNPTTINRTWGNYQVQERSFNACQDSHRVKYFIVQGAGHTTSFGGNLNLYQLIWTFFMSSDPDYYEPFLIGMDLTENEKDLFVVNAQRFQEICLDNFSGLKNPLWNIKERSEWPIYFHFESWEGPVTSTAISQMKSDYQAIADQWAKSIHPYDSNFPDAFEVKIFGFVFNQGVSIDGTFYNDFGEYPRVENFNGTSERSPWEVRFRESNEIFDQNWYSVSDFYSLKVTGNGENDSGNIVFFPETWDDFDHPESIDMFLTKFWHKTTWDAVAQRQYLKLGGNVIDYSLGITRYVVFAHEMGHTFFLDDIYSRSKYPDGAGITSIMNNSSNISDFDQFTMRIVWSQQE